MPGVGLLKPPEKGVSAATTLQLRQIKEMAMGMIEDRVVVVQVRIALQEEIREGRAISCLRNMRSGGIKHGIAQVVLSRILVVMTAVAVLCLADYADYARKPVADLCLGWNKITDTVSVEESLITAVPETTQGRLKEAPTGRDIRAVSDSRVRSTVLSLIRLSEARKL